MTNKLNFDSSWTLKFEGNHLSWRLKRTYISTIYGVTSSTSIRTEDAVLGFEFRGQGCSSRQGTFNYESPNGTDSSSLVWPWGSLGPGLLTLRYLLVSARTKACLLSNHTGRAQAHHAPLRWHRRSSVNLDRPEEKTCFTRMMVRNANEDISNLLHVSAEPWEQLSLKNWSWRRLSAARGRGPQNGKVSCKHSVLLARVSKGHEPGTTDMQGVRHSLAHRLPACSVLTNQLTTLVIPRGGTGRVRGGRIAPRYVFLRA